MADHSCIEWTEATWNPVVGCTLASPGCTHCYAMPMARRIEAMQPGSHYAGTTKLVNGKPVWTGKLALAPEHILTQPLRWRRPRKIFVNSMGDLFHEAVPDYWIDQVFAVMALCRQHTFQVLTKRSARMREYMSAPDISGRWVEASWPLGEGAPLSPQKYADRFHFGPPGQKQSVFNRFPLPNVWLGVSTEDQRRADERVPDLLATPAAIRFVSAEPLLGPIDIRRWIPTCYECGASCGHRLPGIPDVERCTKCGEECGPDTSPVFSDGCPKCNGELEPVCPDCGHYMVYQHPDTPNIDLVIVGGESGRRARPMHPDWARALRDQCATADVPFFFKQWGAYAPLLKSMSVYAASGGACNIAWPDGSIGPGSAETNGGTGQSLFLGTKHITGRLLDGIEHNGMPEART